jgi:hypothetical protein
MKTSKRGAALKKLLDICADLQRLRGLMADPELRRETRTSLRRRSRAKAKNLARDLSAYRYRGPLGQVMREFRFSADHFQVLSTLLDRHLRSEDPALEGRLLLASVYDSPFEVLSGITLLQETSPLRQSRMIVLADDEDRPQDLLEARFRLSDDALVAFREEVGGRVPEDLRLRREVEGYVHPRDFLVDLRILHNLYRLRAERVFHQDRWDRVHNIGPVPGRSITRRIDAMWRVLRRRLDATPQASLFPAARFMQQHSLSDAEMMIVVHLLFRELYEGNAYADAAELVRLVSADESELIRNRRLLLSAGRLASAEIIENEPMLEGRELTGEVHLRDWAVNELFGTAAGDEAIGSDERLDWHLYLKNLGDTRTFFRDLDAN